MERGFGMSGWRGVARAAGAVLLAAAVGGAAAATDGPKRVRIAGEVIDSWCQISGIMGIGAGSAHHQCAIWCAVGGIPVGLLGDDGNVYILLKTDDTATTVQNPAVIDMQTDHVVADADLYERDGTKYLVFSKVIANEGIKNLNHKDFGIVPFGE